MTHQELTRRFYKLIWPHRAMVLRTAMFLTHDAAEAEDLAQESLLKAFKSLDTFAEGSNITGWLTKIVRHTRIDQLRAAAKHAQDVSLDGAAMDVAGPMVEADVESPDASTVLERLSDQVLIDALKKLPEEMKWTVLLVDVQQMDYQQAAEILKIPEGTVKSRLFRGRRMLKEMLLRADIKNASTS